MKRAKYKTCYYNLKSTIQIESVVLYYKPKQFRPQFLPNYDMNCKQAIIKIFQHKNIKTTLESFLRHFFSLLFKACGEWGWGKEDYSIYIYICIEVCQNILKECDVGASCKYMF